MNTKPQTAIVPISSITFGDRTRQDYGDIAELKKSIQEKGLIQPIAVKDLNNGSFLLLAGGRRLRACAELNLSEIPIRIYTHELTEEEAKTIELEENLQRLNLSWPEECKLVKQIQDLQVAIHGVKVSTSPGAAGWSQQDTSELLNINKQQTSTDIQLAKALEIIPILATCDTKSDAIKLMKKLLMQFDNSQIVLAAATRQATTPIEVLRKQITDAYLINDCVEGMKQIPDQSIDLVEIDPPYAIKLQEVKFVWQQGDLQHDSLMKEDYNEIEGDLYLPFIEKVTKEAFRVMKPDSWLLFWFAPDPWFNSIYKLIQQAGFFVRRLPLLWVKKQGQTLMPARYLAHAYEMCFYARKGNPVIQKQGRIDTFEYPIVHQSRRIHPTERPLEMMEDLLATFTTPNSSVLVPFAGSGNTILAAFNLGMTAFGFDLSKAYRDAFVVRALEFTPRSYQPLA